MRLTKLCLLALASDLAYGYLDASPFFMFSASEYGSARREWHILLTEIRLLIPSPQLQFAKSITSDISRTLSQCPSDYYIFVSQPGVSASDYSSPKAAPALSRYMNAGKPSDIRSTTSISEVVGEVEVALWRETVRESCGAKVTHVDATSKQAIVKIVLEITNITQLAHFR